MLFIPIDMLIKANRVKYKYLALPTIIILLNFIFSFVLPALSFKYTSLFALIIYFIILIVFRFRRDFAETNDNVVFAPITGKITNIKTLETGHIVTIKKSFFATCEVVTCTKNDIPDIMPQDTTNNQVSWHINCANKHIFINETVKYQAVLVGVAPGNATCDVFIPNDYELDIEVDGKVDAGLSELAVVNNNGL